MSKRCEICGKTKSFGNKVTFSNKKSGSLTLTSKNNR